MKKRKSPLAVIIVILLIIVVVISLITNLVFSMSDSPHLFGYYVTIEQSDDMEPDIEQGDAVISKEYKKGTDLTAGTKVLCFLADGSMAVRYIYSQDVDANGQPTYVPATMKEAEPGSETPVPSGNIIGVCTVKSGELAAFVSFARSIYGIGILLILPCLILIIMLIRAIVKAPAKPEPDEEEFEEEPAKSKKKKKKKGKKAAAEEDLTDDDYINEDLDEDVDADDDDNQNYSEDDDYDAPLYRTTQMPAQQPKKQKKTANTLDTKKQTISRNFRDKKVDQTSPFRKAIERERTVERTMKFNVNNSNSNGLNFDSTPETPQLSPRHAASVKSENTQPQSPAPTDHSSMSEFDTVKPDIKVGNYNEPKPDFYAGKHAEIPSELEESENINTQNTVDNEVDNLDDVIDTSDVIKADEPISKHEAAPGDDTAEKEMTEEEQEIQKIKKEEATHKAPDLTDILNETSTDDDDYVRPDQDDIKSIDDLISIIEKEKNKMDDCSCITKG